MYPKNVDGWGVYCRTAVGRDSASSVDFVHCHRRCVLPLYPLFSIPGAALKVSVKTPAVLPSMMIEIARESDRVRQVHLHLPTEVLAARCLDPFAKHLFSARTSRAVGHFPTASCTLATVRSYLFCFYRLPAPSLYRHHLPQALQLADY